MFLVRAGARLQSITTSLKDIAWASGFIEFTSAFIANQPPENGVCFIDLPWQRLDAYGLNTLGLCLSTLTHPLLIGIECNIHVTTPV